MNVISTKLSQDIFTRFILLSKAGFLGISLCITDNKQTAL